MSYILFYLIFLIEDCFGYGNGKPYSVGGSPFHDCTEKFKHRLASFEYQYYPGYFMYPSKNHAPYIGIAKSDYNSIKKKKWYKWNLHGDGDFIHIESVKYPNKYYDTGDYTLQRQYLRMEI